MLHSHTSAEVYLVGIPIIIGLIIVELIVSSSNQLRLYDPKDSLASLGLLFGNAAISLLVKSMLLAFSFFLYEFRMLSLNQLLSPLALWALTIILIDLVFLLLPSVLSP